MSGGRRPDEIVPRAGYDTRWDLLQTCEELAAIAEGRLLHPSRLYAVPPDGGRVTVTRLPSRDAAADASPRARADGSPATAVGRDA